MLSELGVLVDVSTGELNGPELELPEESGTIELGESWRVPIISATIPLIMLSLTIAIPQDW